jgi:glutaryl-CoA dehydrogenase
VWQGTAAPPRGLAADPRSQSAQFGKPLASFQIIQQRLVSMLADLTATQLYCLQTGRLAEADRLT